jgi:hypothetical protein
MMRRTGSGLRFVATGQTASRKTTLWELISDSRSAPYESFEIVEGQMSVGFAVHHGGIKLIGKKKTFDELIEAISEACMHVQVSKSTA